MCGFGRVINAFDLGGADAYVPAPVRPAHQASKKAAGEMVTGYGIAGLDVAPALASRHTEGKAVDMQITWKGTLKIKNKDGAIVEIDTTPRNSTNAKLIEVGATYGVIHFKDVDKDKVHWSTDGK